MGPAGKGLRYQQEESHPHEYSIPG